MYPGPPGICGIEMSSRRGAESSFSKIIKLTDPRTNDIYITVPIFYNVWEEIIKWRRFRDTFKLRETCYGLCFIIAVMDNRLEYIVQISRIFFDSLLILYSRFNFKCLNLIILQIYCRTENYVIFDFQGLKNCHFAKVWCLYCTKRVNQKLFKSCFRRIHAIIALLINLPVNLYF